MGGIALRKKTGRLTGWIAYLGRDLKRQIAGINLGMVTTLSRTGHTTLSRVGMYKLSPNDALSNWV